MSELDSGSTDTAASGMNEQALTHLQTRLRKEGIVRRDKDFWDTARLDKIQVLGNLYQQALVCQDIFRLRSAARQAHDSLPRFPRPHQ
jgi:hypothetical protein